MKINLWVESIVAIIVEDEKSPATYSNQTNGHACSHPEINGYLVPVEFKGSIAQKFLNLGYAGSGWELDNSFYDDVPEILNQLKEFFRNYVFELDESKIKENTEAWVHLVGKRDKPDHYSDIIQGFPDTFAAILTWANSD